MRRVAFAILVLLMTLTTSAAVKVIAIKHVAAGGGGGNLLSETFDGATGGYDNTWTESGTGTIDQDETAACGTGTGWATECLEFNLTGSQTGASTSAFASQTGDVWVRFRAKITYDLSASSDSEGFVLAAINSSASSLTAGGTALAIYKFGGGTPTYEISLRSGNTEKSFTTAPASGETHCYEFWRNSTDDSWEWWIDGASQGSASSGGAFSAGTNLWLQGAPVPASSTATLYFDDVQVSNEARQTCP